MADVVVLKEAVKETLTLQASHNSLQDLTIMHFYVSAYVGSVGEHMYTICFMSAEEGVVMSLVAVECAWGEGEKRGRG